MKILTHDGFKDFGGFICRNKTSEVLEIHCNGSKIRCTHDHRFMMNDGNFQFANKLKINDVLFKNKKIEKINEIVLEKEIDVFDALNVSDTHSYLTNGFVSHNCLLLDEFAHIKNDVDFFTSTYPVISSGKKSRVIITSTPNGLNLFYKIWNEAVEARSEFFPIKFTWRDHPQRDDAWMKKTVSIMGADAFAQEHEGEFMGSSGTLISGRKLKSLSYTSPVKESNNYKEYLSPSGGRSYVACIDVSEGVGNDYSVCTIIDVTQQPFQVAAIYRNNAIAPDALADVLYQILVAYNTPFCVVETNGVGVIVGNNLIHELEYENLLMSESKNGKIEPSNKAKSSVGIRQTKSTKKIGCSRLKQLIESDALVINDYDLLQELYSFSRKAGSYQAENGKHDDIVMTLVLFGWLVEQELFAEITTDNIKKLLRHQYIENQFGDELDFGFHIDGTEDPTFDEGFHRAVNNSSQNRTKWN